MGVHKPANVTVTTVSGSSILIEWENMDEYDNIDLKRNVDGGDYVYRMDFDGGVESFLDAECEKEKTYCYILQGIIFTEEDEEVSGWTDPVCALTLADLAAPSDLVATPISDTKVDLTFKVNSLVEDSVRIERKPDGGEYAEIAVLAPRRDFYRDTGLIKNTEYDWRVRVRRDDPLENSDYCTEATATTIDNPGIPTLADILDADTKDKSIRIRWSDVANETGYRIEKSDDDSFAAEEGELIAVVGAGVTDFLITGLTPDTPYWFRVRAYNAAGYSAYSDVRTATTDAAYVPTEFEKWIRNPGIKPVYLAEVNLKMDLSGFTLIAEKTHVYGYNERLLDGGLELWDDEYNLTHWVEDITGDSTIHRESSEKIEGAFSCRIDVDADNSRVGIRSTNIPLTPLKRYKLIIWYMHSAEGKTNYFILRNVGSNVWLKSDGTWQTTGEVLIGLPNSITWTKYEIEFYAHSDYSTYDLYIARASNASSSFYLDNISIEEFPIFQPERGLEFDNIWENGNALTKKTSIATVEATAGTWWWDTAARKLYVHSSTGADPDGFLIEGGFWLYISNEKNIEFNGNFYLPLLSKEDIPDITQEIKPYFEGNFGMSSGSIAFANAKIGGEHFFDKKFATYSWMNAKTILKAGKDTFTYAQFKEIFTALIDSKSINDKKITFQLRDIREDMENKIILNKFDVTNYPDVEEKFRDKPIPVYFGTQNLITPIRVDEINERFKCNDGRIKSIDSVYKNGAKLEENAHYYIDLQRARITFDREGAFIITAGANDKIDFKESGGAELHATLDPDTYTTTELCAEIKRAMEAASGLERTYTITVDADTKKFTIACGGLSILWKSGTNGSDGTDTHVGTTIGFADGEDCEGKASYEADEDVISIRSDDIIGVQLRGIVNSADEVISNGAEVFKYLMNTYKGLGDSELNLDSIYEAKYANVRKLSIPIESEISFDEIVRTTEHSLEAYTFQDPFGRLGIRPQQTTVASKAKHIISDHMFGHSQKKDKSSLYWKVNIYYNKNLQSDVWEVKTATDNEINWKYDVTKELPIHTYFRDAVNAQALATSILSLLNKAKVEVGLPMLLFDVIPGDLAVFSRTRFYNSAGTADEITLRINRISKSPASGRTSITAGVV